VPERASESRVVIVTNVPAPYRLDLFKRVHRRFSSFTVIFDSEGEMGRHWDLRPSLPFEARYLKGLTLPVGERRVRLHHGLIGEVRELRPSIVVAGGFSPGVALLGMYCAKVGLPLILFNDGTILTDPTSGPEFPYRRWLVKLARGCIAASTESRRYFLKLGVGSERIETVQLTRDLVGISLHVTKEGARANARARWNLGSRVICFIGQMVDRKRPSDVLDAYELAARRVDDLWLLMVGEGEELARVQQMARERDLRRVVFLGHLPWVDILDVLTASDAGVYPSISEPYGMVVIESLAAGVPVITTTRVGSAKDLIQHGVNGFLLEPLDVAGLAKAIETVFSDQVLARALSSAASRVVDRHDVEAEAERFVHAIEHLGSLAPQRVEARSARSSGGKARAQRMPIIVTRVIAPYRVPLYRELAKEGLLGGVVVAGRSDDAVPASVAAELPRDLPVRWCASGMTYRRDVLDSCRSLDPGLILVEHGARLDFVWTILASHSLSAVPKVLWTHGIENRERLAGTITPASIGRWLQLHCCDGVLCYDRQMAARMTQRYPQKVVRAAPNSTDGSVIQEVCGARPSGRRKGARERLGLKRSVYLIYLGRLIAGKRPADMIRVLGVVRGTFPDACAIVVGDGPERSVIENLAKDHNLVIGADIILAGEVRDQSGLAHWLSVADVNINPGYAGLSVVDALFAGVPTVLSRPSARGPYHSPEWQYLLECRGGLFADSADSTALGRRTAEYLALPESERSDIGADCARYASQTLGIGKMVEGIREIVEGFRESHTSS